MYGINYRYSHTDKQQHFSFEIQFLIPNEWKALARYKGRKKRLFVSGWEGAR